MARVDGPLLVLNLNLLLWTALIPFPTAVVARYLQGGSEPARTAAALYAAVFLLMSIAFAGLFAWVTHDQRLVHRLPPPEVVRAARLRFMAGLAAYVVALGRAWLSAVVSVALCGVTAMYYAFDQASVRERGGGDRQVSRRPA